MMAPQTLGQPGSFDYVLLGLLAAIWGSSFLFIKIAVDGVPAITMTALRLAVSGVFLAVLAWAMGQKIPFERRYWVPILLGAASGNALPFVLIGWGEEKIDSNLAAILMAPNPLITLVLAHLFTTDEKLSAGKLAGVGLGVIGLLVLIGPSTLAQIGDDVSRQLAVGLAGACYATNAVISRRLLMDTPPYGTAAAVLIASAAMVVPFVPLDGDLAGIAPTTSSLLAIVVLGVLNTAVGTLIFFAIVRRQGASFYSQINYLVPLLGVVYGALFLAERPSPNALVALVLILIGVAVARR
jgi:drug/metabolite transporter (DMT)-like permease